MLKRHFDILQEPIIGSISQGLSREVAGIQAPYLSQS